MEDLPIKGYRGSWAGAQGVPLFGGPPVHKFSFWDPKVHLPGPSCRLDNPKGSLECPNVCSVGEGCRREAQIVLIGKGDSLGEVDVERGNINYEE